MIKATGGARQMIPACPLQLMQLNTALEGDF